MIVERFLQWARTAPVARRAEAAQALARAYLDSPLQPEQRDQVEAAMTVLLDDGAAEVRLALAEELAEHDHAPHHIILSLASDSPPIAGIVAERSPLILDSELVDMIGAGEESVQIAIARRPFLSRAVSAALAEVGTATACAALVANPGARVPRFSLDRVVERYGDEPALRLTLLDRDDLPADVRQNLVARLAGSLRDLIVQRDWLPPDRAETVTREARDRATIASAFEAPTDHMPALVARLLGAGELTPSFLIRAAVSGQTLLFETALAALASVPRERVGALIASGRASSLKALIERAGLPMATYPAFAATFEVMRKGEGGHDPGSEYRRATHLIDAIVSRYAQRRDRELDQILALLRRFAVEAKRAAARDFAREMMEAA
jgi:uncharacterized protein (DUF2336 family)